MLLIVFIVCERVSSVWSSKYIHTLFLSAAVAEVQLAFWQARHFLANFWLHGAISILSHIHRHRVVLLFKSQCARLLMAAFVLGTNTALWQEIELFQRVTGWELPCATSVSTPLDCVNPLAFKQGGKGQGEMEKGLCQCSAARNFSPVWVSRWTDTVVSSVCWTHQYNSECLYCLHTVDWLEKTVVKK